MQRFASSRSRLRIPLVVGLLATAVLMVAACTSSDAAEDAGNPTPEVTAPGDDHSTDGPSSDGAGGGIEPANPDSPPAGSLGSSSGSVALGLGSYCWSPPEGSDMPGLCADAIGIITGMHDLPVVSGESLEVSGDLTLPPMHIAFAMLYDAPASVVEPAAPDFRAWHPAGDARQLSHGDHSIALPDDLAPGRYLLAVNYTAGADRGSEATYGAILIVE